MLDLPWKYVCEECEKQGWATERSFREQMHKIPVCSDHDVPLTRVRSPWDEAPRTS